MDRRIYLIGLGAFAVSSIAFLFAGLLPLIAADTGITVPQAGYLAFAYSMAYALGTPVISAFVGGYDRRHVVTAALFFFVVGCTLTAASHSLTQLVVAQIVTGFAAGQFAAGGQAVAVTLAPADRRAAAISIVVGGTTFAVALGAPLGSFLAHSAGWRIGFVLVGAVAALCLLALWFVLPKRLPGARLPLRARLNVVRRPGVTRLILTTLVYLTGAFTVVAYLGPIATEGAGIAEDMLPLVLLLYGLGAICGNWIAGRVADRAGPRRVVLISMGSSAVISVLLVLLLDFAPQAIAAPLLIALMFVWGVLGWVFPPAQTSRLVGRAPDVAHLTLALHASAIYLGVALGNFAGGRILEMGSVAGIGVIAAVFALGAFAMTLIDRHGLVVPAPAE